MDMLKLFAVSCLLICCVGFATVRMNVVVSASTRLSFLMNPQDLEPLRYITVTGENQTLSGSDQAFVLLKYSLKGKFPQI